MRTPVAALAVLIAGSLALAPAGQGADEPSGEDPFVIGTVIQRGLDHQEAGLMRQGGIDSVRFFMPWSQIEAQRGEYDWSFTDEVVRETANAGLTPLPFILGSPEWSARADGYDCDQGGCSAFGPATSASRAAFAEFARAAVRRYGPDGVFWQNNPVLFPHPIEVWQLWNEPNLRSFWAPFANPTAYAALVQEAAGAIRAEDPDAEVLLAGLSGKVSTSRRMSTQSFLRQLYEVPDFSESFDGVAVHPYDGRVRGVARQVRNAHRIIQKRDPGGELWITEVGWASSGPRDENLVKSLDGQARALRRLYRLLMRRADRWELQGAYWFAWRDTEPFFAVCEWCGSAGLRYAGGDPKPAYDSLQRLATR